MRKNIDDMSTDEKLAEVLVILRGFEDALNKLGESPMARMIPGFSGNGGMLSVIGKK